MYLFKTDTFFHINHYLKSVSKLALLHKFHCTASAGAVGGWQGVYILINYIAAREEI